jgi:tetratricopeptide (TPR) repeat protein
VPELRLKDKKLIKLFEVQLFFLLIFFFSPSAGLSAEEEKISVDAKLQMDLADHFFQEGDYYRAITEYKRFLFFFPHNIRTEEAQWKIGRSYFNGMKWDEAIAANDNLIKKFPSTRYKADAMLLTGLCFKEKKEYSQARFFFGKAKEEAADAPTADEAQWQIAATYLKEEKWQEAAYEYRKINKNSKLYLKSEYFAQGLDRIHEIPQKSPTTAGVLAAIVPGSGHLYCERYRDASTAFLLNGAFIWGMVEAFERKNYVVGGILTFFELGWYSGNIYSAVASAHKYNRRKKQEYLDYLEKGGPLSVGVSIQGKSPVLSLNYVF